MLKNGSKQLKSLLMKKQLFYLFFLCTFFGFAQSGINYSAIIKDNAGTVLTNQNVTLEFSIFQGVSQTLVYTETHSVTTNANGYVNAVIGQGTITFILGSGVSFESDRHFIETKIDSGSGLVSLGITELNAVPYAIHSRTANELTGTIDNLSDDDEDTFINVETTTDSDKVEIRTNGTTEMVLDQTGLVLGSYDKLYNPATLNSKRMFYDKNKSALRGGFNNNTSWDDANVGLYSFSFGENTRAIGQTSAAFGGETEADHRAFAIGWQSKALGSYSFAGGWQSQSVGTESFAFGDNIRSNSSQFTVGSFNAPYTGVFAVGNGTSETNRRNTLEVGGGTINLPLLANGEIQDLQLDTNGAVIVKPILTKKLVLSGLNLVPSYETQAFIKSSKGAAMLQAGNWFMPINLPEGAIIKRLSFIYKDTSIANVTFSLIRTSLTTGGSTTLYTYDSVNFGNTFQTINSNELTIPISNFSNFVITMTAGNNSDELRAIRVEYLEP